MIIEVKSPAITKKFFTYKIKLFIFLYLNEYLKSASAIITLLVTNALKIDRKIMLDKYIYIDDFNPELEKRSIEKF